VQHAFTVTRLFAPVASDRLQPEVVAAFEDACATQLAPVFAYIRYRVDSAQTAEELTGATFLRALERIHSYDRARGEMRQWIFAIARHLVADHLRAQRRWIVIPLEWLGAHASTAATPEETAVEAEIHGQLVQAMAQLRGRERDLLGMKFGAGLTNREIAGVTGLTEGHVAVLVQRALARLKARLATRGVTHV
jgi:RNA polymerase sigma-70 factor (ECF subfamily)